MLKLQVKKGKRFKFKNIYKKNIYKTKKLIINQNWFFLLKSFKKILSQPFAFKNKNNNNIITNFKYIKKQYKTNFTTFIFFCLNSF